MTSPYGQKAGVAICFQDSYGTSNVNSLHWIPFVSEGIGINKPPLVSKNMRGIFDNGDDYEGANMVDGDLVAEAQPIALGAMMATVFGKPTTANSGGVYIHTFKPKTADFDILCAGDPFTYYKYLNVGSASLFQDLCGTKLTLGIAAGELLQATVEVVGGQDSQVGNVAASYEIGKRWAWSTASLSLNGTATDVFKDVKIVLDEKLEAQHTVNGSKYPSRVKRSDMRMVEVSGTMKFESQTEYQNFLNQTEQPFNIYFNGPTEIQSSIHETLELQMPALRWHENKPVVPGPGPIEVSLTGEAKYHVGSGNTLTAILVNTLAGY